MMLNELLLPRMEKFIMRFPAFQKLEEVAVVADTPAIVAKPTEEGAITETTPQPTEYEVLRPIQSPSKSVHHKRNYSAYSTIPSRQWLPI